MEGRRGLGGDREVTPSEPPAHNPHCEAFSLINAALKRLDFKVGEEPLVHQPTWLSLFAARESHAPAREEASGGPDNRVSFPEGRAALLPTIPPIQTFLVQHGVITLLALVGALLLPLMHIFRNPRERAGFWMHGGGPKTELLLDFLSWFCVCCCCCVACCWAFPLFYMAVRRENKAVMRQCRCAPLDAQHASLHPVHPSRRRGREHDEGIHPHKHHTELLLVLMNPASGAGSAIQQYQQTIAPGVDVTAPDFDLTFGPQSCHQILICDTQPVVICGHSSSPLLTTGSRLLERGGDRLLLPLILDSGSSDFLFLFLFAFAPLFSCCLLLGGDGTYNTITSLLMRIAAARRGESLGPSPRAPAAATAAERAAAAATATEAAARLGLGEQGRSNNSRNSSSSSTSSNSSNSSNSSGNSRIGAGPGRPLTQSHIQDKMERGFGRRAETEESLENARSDAESAPTMRKNSRRSVRPHVLPMGAPHSSSSSCSTSCGSRSSRTRSGSSRRQDRAVDRSENHPLALTPVPVGTSNTWCSEFVFSEGGLAAGQQYIADMEAEIDALKAALDNCAAEGDAAAGAAAERGQKHVEEETAAALEQPPAAEDLVEAAARFEAEEEAWEQRVLEEEEGGVDERDRAAAAAAGAARLHSKAAADRETDARRKLQFLFAAEAALLVEKRLLFPRAEGERKRRKENNRQHLQQQLAIKTQQLKGLAAFVSGIGPGRDSNLTRKGFGGMLQFWCRPECLINCMQLQHMPLLRLPSAATAAAGASECLLWVTSARIAEGQSTFTSILKVRTGIHTNYCVNNLECGYLGTCMVHSEDLRAYGHLRYLLAPLYQIIEMKKQHLIINATLANGTQITREGEYLAVALDLVQHWTDNVCATPWAQVNSHYAWLLLIDAGVSRPLLWAYARNLHQLGPNCPGTERLPVRKVSLQMDEEGVFGLDGEVYTHDGHLTLEVLPRAARVMVSRHDVEKAEAAAHPAWARVHFEAPVGE
ncbi:hypothetical protein ACSSS7_003709 [Eimeria intestinalis]